MTARLLPETADLINYAEPDETGLRMVMAADLMRDLITRTRLEAGLANLDQVLADENLSAAELKGVLNRVSGGVWGMEYARPFTPREVLEELRTAIRRHLEG